MSNTFTGTFTGTFSGTSSGAISGVAAIALCFMLCIEATGQTGLQEIAQLATTAQSSKVTEFETQRSNNFDVMLSQKMLEAYVNSQFSRCKPVKDCILGTAISGQSSINGSTTVQINPDSSRVNLTILIQTTAHSDTVGLNGPVNIFSNSVTNITTRKPILFDGETITTLPASSQAASQSNTKGISTKFSGILDRVVRRVAARQVEKKKDESSAIAARHAERDTNTSTDLEVARMLEDSNRAFQEEVKRPGTIRGFLPKQLNLSSDGSAIRIATLLAGTSQLGAPSASRIVLPNGDVRLQLHQTGINNLLATYLSGKTFSLNELDNLQDLSQVGSKDRSTPKSLEKDSKRQILITLDEQSPVEVLFDQGACLLTIRAQKVQIDSQAYSAMNISLRYNIESESGKWFLNFDGQPVIVPPRLASSPTGRLSGPEVAMRRILRNAIVKDVPASAELKPFPLQKENKSIGTLTPSYLNSTGGWLGFSANFVPSPPAS